MNANLHYWYFATGVLLVGIWATLTFLQYNKATERLLQEETTNDVFMLTSTMENITRDKIDQHQECITNSQCTAQQKADILKDIRAIQADILAITSNEKDIYTPYFYEIYDKLSVSIQGLFDGQTYRLREINQLFSSARRYHQDIENTVTHRRNVNLDRYWAITLIFALLFLSVLSALFISFQRFITQMNLHTDDNKIQLNKIYQLVHEDTVQPVLDNSWSDQAKAIASQYGFRTQELAHLHNHLNMFKGINKSINYEFRGLCGWWGSIYL